MLRLQLTGQVQKNSDWHHARAWKNRSGNTPVRLKRWANGWAAQLFAVMPAAFRLSGFARSCLLSSSPRQAYTHVFVLSPT